MSVIQNVWLFEVISLTHVVKLNIIFSKCSILNVWTIYIWNLISNATTTSYAKNYLYVFNTKGDIYLKLVQGALFSFATSYLCEAGFSRIMKANIELVFTWLQACSLCCRKQIHTLRVYLQKAYPSFSC